MWIVSSVIVFAVSIYARADDTDICITRRAALFANITAVFAGAALANVSSVANATRTALFVSPPAVLTSPTYTAISREA